MPRLIAEWEEQESILVVFPHGKTDWIEYLDDIKKSYLEFIKILSFYQKCIVICGDEKDIKMLPKNDNIVALHVNTNDTWIRDFGAIEVFDDEKIIAYDFIFNAWGGKFDSNLDDKVNQILYEKGILKGNLIRQNFILEGGSIDTNGKGAFLTTATCIYNKNRNKSYSYEEIKNKLCKLFGINDFICLKHGYIKGDDTDSHIDILARFIDEKTIAYVTCKNENDEHFIELKKMEEELKNTNFNLLPLPLPEPVYYKDKRLGATYANFVFVNKALIVPTYGQKYDLEVVDILQKALPHLEVKGVDARVFLRQNGSLHCASINRFLGKRD